MKTIGAIDQNVSAWGHHRSGFEVRRYDFRLNEQGKKFALVKARENPDLWAALNHAADRLKLAGDIHYMDMSIAAKTFLMLAQKRERKNIGEFSEFAQHFGWKVTPLQAKYAAEYLSKLGLVELT